MGMGSLAAEAFLTALSHSLRFRSWSLRIAWRNLGAGTAHKIMRELPSLILAQTASAYIIEYPRPPPESGGISDSLSHDNLL